MKKVIILVGSLLFVIIIFIIFTLANGKWKSESTQIQGGQKNDRVTSQNINNKPKLTDWFYFGCTFKSEDFDCIGFNIFKSQISSKQVFEKFGEPIERKQEPCTSRNYPDLDYYYDIWTYSDLEFRFLSYVKKGSPAPTEPILLIAIRVKRGDFETYRGIKIGDSKEKVVSKYGEIPVDNNYISYNNGLFYIDFGIKENKVSEIIFIGEPD